MRIIVDADNPCSRYYVDQGIRIPRQNHSGGYDVNSIELAFYYLHLAQNGNVLHAEHVATSQALLRCPRNVQTYALQQLTVTNAETLFRCTDIMYSIFVHLLTSGNTPFRREFDRIARMRGSVQDLVRFLVPNGQSERKWSTGIRKAALERGERPLGLNRYGKLLDRAFQQFLSGAFDNQLNFHDLSMKVAISGPFKKTVLLVSDSYAKYVGSIEGGNVHAKGGAQYDYVAEYLKKCQLSDYKFVILNVGFNCARGHPDRWLDNWQPLETVLKDGLKGCSTRLILNSGMALPMARGDVPAHTAVIKEQFEKEFTDRDRFRFCDWSDAAAIPFLKSRTELDESLFDPGRYEIHLNHTGFTIFWYKWCELFPELLNISFSMTPKAYSTKEPDLTGRQKLPVFDVVQKKFKYPE